MRCRSPRPNERVGQTNAMTTPRCDVAIVGGGPGGCATALSLRSHARSLAVVLIEASAYQPPRLGETLPPLARRLLEHLGVWEAFERQGHREVYGTAAAWGDAGLRENDFIFTPHNTAWHLDRAAFDAMLAREAAWRGACVRLRTRVCDTTREGSVWRLQLSDGSELVTRFAVDATGNASVIGRRSHARLVISDHLTGFARFFQEERRADPRTLVEAFADGWWYTAGIPGGRCLAVCLTDTDLARRLRLADLSQWSQQIEATTHIRQALYGVRPHGPLIVRTTSSRRLEPVAGDGWLAVGDAASTFDPLSSQGIIKALRSGIFASYAIADLLTRGTDAGLARYRRYVREEFESYLQVRAKYYGEERRWPHSAFWRRRQVL
jgi:flavin-dependent dehydrogenase